MRWVAAADVVAFAIVVDVLVLRVSALDGSLVLVGIGTLLYLAVRLVAGPRRG